MRVAVLGGGELSQRVEEEDERANLRNRALRAAT
jgi:hypothetical protein